MFDVYSIRLDQCSIGVSLFASIFASNFTPNSLQYYPY